MTATERAVELVRRRRPRGRRQARAPTSSPSTCPSSWRSPTCSCSARRQRPAGPRDRRRDRGEAARARRQAGPARGRARGPLGAARLRRHRGPRPARRGARVLRARAALARLPGRIDLERGPTRQVTPLSRRAGTADGVERRGPRPGPERHPARRGRPRAGQPRPPGWPALGARPHLSAPTCLRASRHGAGPGAVTGVRSRSTRVCARLTSGPGRG